MFVEIGHCEYRLHATAGALRRAEERAGVSLLSAVQEGAHALAKLLSRLAVAVPVLYELCTPTFGPRPSFRRFAAVPVLDLVGIIGRLHTAVLASFDAGPRQRPTVDVPAEAITWHTVIDWTALSGLSPETYTIGELARGAEARARDVWTRQAQIVHYMLAPHMKDPPDPLALNPYISPAEANEMRARERAKQDAWEQRRAASEAKAKFYHRHWQRLKEVAAKTGRNFSPLWEEQKPALAAEWEQVNPTRAALFAELEDEE